jgi:hypothetical protein
MSLWERNWMVFSRYVFFSPIITSALTAGKWSIDKIVGILEIRSSSSGRRPEIHHPLQWRGTATIDPAFIENCGPWDIADSWPMKCSAGCSDFRNP